MPMREESRIEPTLLGISCISLVWPSHVSSIRPCFFPVPPPSHAPHLYLALWRPWLVPMTHHIFRLLGIFFWHSAGRASLILQISAQMLQALWNSLISDVHGRVPSLVCCNHLLYSSYMLGVLNLAHTLRSVHPQHLAPSRCSEIALWMNIYGYFVLF